MTLILDLSTAGFRKHGQSWLLDVGENQLSVIAIGGKFSQASALCRTICLRNHLMRTREETIPKGFVKDPFDYPIKMDADEINNFDAEIWTYKSRLLNYPMTYLRTQQECVKLSFSLTTRLIPWAGALTAAQLRSEILRNGQNGWIEKMWIEDLTPIV